MKRGTDGWTDGRTDGRMRYGRHGQYGFNIARFFYTVTEQFVGRLVYSKLQSPRGRWAQDGPMGW